MHAHLRSHPKNNEPAQQTHSQESSRHEHDAETTRRRLAQLKLDLRHAEAKAPPPAVFQKALDEPASITWIRCSPQFEHFMLVKVSQLNAILIRTLMIWTNP